MSTIALNADSTSLVLNGTPITDFVAGDILELTPVNPLTGRINGTNNSVNVNKRSDAGVHNLVIRVQKYSASDIFLNNARNQETPVIFNGSMKEEGTSDGTVFVNSYILESGSFTTQPTDTKNDQDGNALMEYTIEFRNAQRNI